MLETVKTLNIIMSSYRVKKFPGETVRYVQTMDLRDDPELIRLYRKWHSEEYNWKEIRDGIREVGILEMEIYLLGCRLVMVLEVPASFNWDEAFARLATLPRQAEWEAFVAKFQSCAANAKSNEKWQQMERIFYLYP